MKPIRTGLIIASSVIGSFMLGNSCSGDDVTEYVQGMQLRQNGEKVVLYHESQDEIYKVSILDDKVFLGDAKHNLIGFQKKTEQKYKGD